jgi:hypothetical protein
MSCGRCKDVGFLWGHLLRQPRLVRCSCNGGPERQWLDDLAAGRTGAPAEVPPPAGKARPGLRGGTC